MAYTFFVLERSKHMFYFQGVVIVLMATSVVYMVGSVLGGYLTDGVLNGTLYSIALIIFILCVMINFFVFTPGHAVLWR